MTTNDPGSVGRIVARGGTITVFIQATKIVAQFIGLVTLSRLLSPHEFGIFAVVTACFSFGEMIRDFGLTSAAVQAARVSNAQYTNLFWACVVLGIAVSGGFAFASPLLTSSINLPPEMVPIICGAFLINSLQTTYQVQLTRQHRFRDLGLSDLAAQLIGIAGAIALAFFGFGIWALASQFLLQYLLLLVTRVAMVRWTPGIPQRGASIGGLLKYGLDVGIAQLLGYAASNVDTFSIAARFGAVPLGYYSRAFQVVAAPLNQLMAPMTNVLLSPLADAHRAGRLAPIYFRLQWIVLLVGSGFFGAVAVNYNAITVTVLGPGWGDSAIFLLILATGAAAQIYSFSAFWVFLATGATRQLLLYNLITKTVTVAFVVTGALISVEAVAFGYMCGLFFASLVCLFWTPRLLSVPFISVLRQALSVIVLLLPAWTASYAVMVFAQNSPPLLSMILGAIAFAGTTFVMCMAVPYARKNIRTAIRATRKSESS